MNDKTQVMLYILRHDSTINSIGQQWMAYGESDEFGPALNVTNPTFISLKQAKKVAKKEMKDINTLGFKMVPERRG